MIEAQEALGTPAKIAATTVLAILKASYAWVSNLEARIDGPGNFDFYLYASPGKKVVDDYDAEEGRDPDRSDEGDTEPIRPEDYPQKPEHTRNREKCATPTTLGTPVSVSEAVRQLESGKRRVTVKSKQEASEVLRELFVGGKKGARNAADFNSTSAKDYFVGENYYHWDDQWILHPEGDFWYLRNHDPFTDPDAFVNHLQVHPHEKPMVKIFFNQ